MVREGLSASPPPAQRSASPVHHAPTPNVPAAPSAMGQPQQTSMFQQMAAAVGSAVRHTIGAGLTGMFSGSGDKEAPAPASAAAAPAQNGGAASGANEPQGSCAWEIKQFFQCAQCKFDLTMCEGSNEALRQCKVQNHS